MKECIICDIDGVYVNSKEWNKYAPKRHDDREGWNEFAKHIDVCKPNYVIIDMLIILNKTCPIIFVTSREQLNREATIEQIEKFSRNKIKIDGVFNKLYMREFNDFRPSSDVKEDILNNKIINEYNPLLAIDDEIENIEMFKRNNIRTLHYTELRDK